MYAYLSIAFGLLFAVVAFLGGVTMLKRSVTWKGADGTVTKVGKERIQGGGTSGGLTMWWVTYRFADESGQARTGTSIPAVRRPRRGSAVPIKYDPDTPKSNGIAYPEETLMLLAAAVLTAFLGTVMLSRGFTDLAGW